MARKLIVNADDLGVTVNVTRGIIECHRGGIVTSASVMVNMPSSAESIRLTREEAPQLRLGLHINLTTGPPLTKYREELKESDGNFIGKTRLLSEINDTLIADVRIEIEAQVDTFHNLTQSAPDHLDSHHHMTYAHPELTRIMLDIASDLGISVRRPFTDVPQSLEAYLTTLNAPQDAEATARTIAEMLSSAAVPMPDYFMHSFFGDRTGLGDLLNDLVDVNDGVTELMCHPGIPDDDLREVSSYVEPRQRELESLTHPTPREVLIANQITLATFSDLSL